MLKYLVLLVISWLIGVQDWYFLLKNKSRGSDIRFLISMQMTGTLAR